MLESIRSFQKEAVAKPQGTAREQFVTAFKEEMKSKMGDRYFEVSHCEAYSEYKVVTNFATEATFIVRCEDRTIMSNHKSGSRQFLNYKNKSVTQARVVNAIFNGYVSCGNRTHTAHLIPKKSSIFVLDLAHMSGTQNRKEAHSEPNRKKATIRNDIIANPDEDVLVCLGDCPSVVERLEFECGFAMELLDALRTLNVCSRGYVQKPDGSKNEGRKLNRGLYVRMTQQKEVPMHKLVAVAFLFDKITAAETKSGEYFKLLDRCSLAVFHKDGNRTNNHVDNLEILTRSEATNRGRKRPRQ